MSRQRNQRSGRIFPHERDADFTGEVIGASLDLEESYVATVHATEKHTVVEETKRRHRNRIKEIYNFFEKEFPDYYQLGVCDLSPEELANPTKYWWKILKI